MIRIGEIIKEDKNILMVVSDEYERIVKRLARGKTHKLLRALVISQTERRYRDFLIFVLLHFDKFNEEFLFNAWQEENFDFDLKNLRFLFGEKKEWQLFLEYEPNNTFEYNEEKYGRLFNDALSLAHYRGRKKKDIIWRRLVSKYLPEIDKLDELRCLILHFIVAQFITSWESSCVLLGKMILQDWPIIKMKEWFCSIFQIYRK